MRSRRRVATGRGSRTLTLQVKSSALLHVVQHLVRERLRVPLRARSLGLRRLPVVYRIDLRQLYVIGVFVVVVIVCHGNALGASVVVGEEINHGGGFVKPPFIIQLSQEVVDLVHALVEGRLV